MWHRIPEYTTTQYNIENSRYSGMVDDLNYVLEELGKNPKDGLFPITLNREYDQGDTYIELHTELIFSVRFGEFLGFFEYPLGLTIELDDRYQTVDIKTHMSYILPKISEDKLNYRGTFYTNNGTSYAAHSINEDHYIHKMDSIIENYPDYFNIKYELVLLKVAADFKDRLMDEKYIKAREMGIDGTGIEQLSENPFEDIYYNNMGGDSPEPYIGRTPKEIEH